MRTIRRISAIIIGFVFFLAGVFKLMDPVGSSLVVEEYLSFFHLGFLKFASYAIGFALAFIETAVGAALITGVWKRLTAIASIAFIGPFTVITAILLITKAEMDCGCFGEVIELTHLQSLIKNLILCLLWVLAFIPFKEHEPTRKIKYGSFALVCISCALFFLYSAFSIPLMDFTDLKTGTEIEEYTVSFSDVNGEYADSLLYNDKVIIASAYNPGTISEKKWQKIADVMRDAGSLGYTTLVLVNSTPEDMEQLVSDPDILGNTYFIDRKVLLSLNRSNGGISYISDGQVISKWSINRPPSSQKLAELHIQNSTEALISENNGPRLKMQGFLLYTFAVMLLL